MKKRVGTKTNRKGTTTTISKDFTRRETSLAKQRFKNIRQDRRLTYKENVKAENASVKKTAIRSGTAGSAAVSATQQPGDTTVNYIEEPKYKNNGNGRDGDKENNQQNGGIGGINGPGDSDFA